MEYSKKDIQRVLDIVDRYLGDINISRVKRKAVCGEIKSTLELENIKIETRGLVKNEKN